VQVDNHVVDGVALLGALLVDLGVALAVLGRRAPAAR